MSTEPPPVSHTVPTSVPRAAALPKEMAPAPRKAPTPAPQPRAPFEEERTDHYDPDPDKTKTSAVTPPLAFDEEPTGFYDPDLAKAAAPADAQTGAIADTQRLKPISPQLIKPVEGDTAKTALPTPPPAAGFSFEDEPTQFIVDEELEEVRAPLSAPVRVAPGPFDFDEEPTEIFFNKEEGIGIPELLAEINDVEGAGGPLNRPIVAPELIQPAAHPGQPPARFGSQRPAALAPPPARWVPQSQPRRTHSTLDTDLPGLAGRWPLLATAALLLLGIAVLLAKTPVGVALGVRSPDAGTIEVRTIPPVRAAVQLDQVFRGTAPLRLSGVRTGPRRLDIQAPGYLPVTREVNVQSETTSAVDIALVPDRPRSPGPADPAPPQNVPAPAPSPPEATAPGATAPSATAPGATASPVPGVVPE
jgi:hypothetical protein